MAGRQQHNYPPSSQNGERPEVPDVNMGMKAYFEGLLNERMVALDQGYREQLDARETSWKQRELALQQEMRAREAVLEAEVLRREQTLKAEAEARQAAIHAELQAKIQALTEQLSRAEMHPQTRKPVGINPSMGDVDEAEADGRSRSSTPAPHAPPAPKTPTRQPTRRQSTPVNVHSPSTRTLRSASRPTPDILHTLYPKVLAKHRRLRFKHSAHSVPYQHAVYR